MVIKQKDVAKMIATRTGLTAKEADLAVDALTEIIAEALVAGDSVSFPEWGTFKTAQHKQTHRRNPHTGESLIVPAYVAPKFVPSAALKRSVRG